MSDAIISKTDSGETARKFEENEEEKPGCAVYLRYVYPTEFDEYVTRAVLSEWLSDRSGLSWECVRKILVFRGYRVPPPSKQKSPTRRVVIMAVHFDASVNCFDAMRQITNAKVNPKKRDEKQRQQSGGGEVVVTDVTCGRHGWFRTLMLKPKGEKFVSVKEARELLLTWCGAGIEICSLEYLKTGAVRDGRIRAVVYAPGRVGCSDWDKVFVDLQKCAGLTKVFECIDTRLLNRYEDGVSEELFRQIRDKYAPKI